MSELPKNAQFVASADARNPHTSETVGKAEVALSPEQQRVFDSLKQRGEALEQAELDARGNAAKKLKELHGKELVDAGLKQMGHGVWETAKSQATWELGGVLIGGLMGLNMGAAAGFLMGNVPHELVQKGFADIRSNLSVYASWMPASNEALGMAIGGVAGSGTGAFIGSGTGSFIGYETAGLQYNKIAEKKGLPPTKWYDWIAANGMLGLLAVPLMRAGSNLVEYDQSIFEFAPDERKNTISTIRKGLLLYNLGQTVFNPITVGGLRNVVTGLWQMRKDSGMSQSVRG